MKLFHSIVKLNFITLPTREYILMNIIFYEFISYIEYSNQLHNDLYGIPRM